MCFQIIHLPQKRTCFRKLTNITFAYLLSPTKQTSIPGCIILAQIGRKLSIVPKIYLLRKLTITFVCLLCSILNNISKKSQKVNHQTRLHNFGPNWVQPYAPKGTLLGNLTNIALMFYIPSCYKISKKILREHIIRLHNFCPNCPLPQKEILLEN